LQLFKKAYHINFDLLSDSDGEIAKSFGVPVKNGGTYEKTINKKH
jgi:peroxiredoxin Q/BCP